MQQNDAKQAAEHMSHLLLTAQKECQADIERLGDPRAQILFATIAETLGGTLKALESYQRVPEGVWMPQIYHTIAARQAQEDLPAAQRPTPKGPQPPVVTDLATDIDEVKPPPRLFTE